MSNLTRSHVTADQLLAALKRNNYNRSATAKELKMLKSSVQHRARRLGITSGEEPEDDFLPTRKRIVTMCRRFRKLKPRKPVARGVVDVEFVAFDWEWQPDDRWSDEQDVARGQE